MDISHYTEIIKLGELSRQNAVRSMLKGVGSREDDADMRGLKQGGKNREVVCKYKRMKYGGYKGSALAGTAVPRNELCCYKLPTIDSNQGGDMFQYFLKTLLWMQVKD